MAKSKKRRVTRVGPKHRLWITIEQDTFEALQASGEKLGYSISALAQRVIIRGVAAGLIEDASPTPIEVCYQLSDDLYGTMKELTKILSDRVDLREHMMATQQQVIGRQIDTITGQAIVIANYEKDEKDRLENEAVQTEAPD